MVGDVSLAHQSPAHGSAGRGDGGGATIEVRAGGNLQAALDAAEPGDQIVLEAGATFVGPFVLPNKAASVEAGLQTRLPAGLQTRPPSYVEAGLQTRLPEILIRTSTPDASLPPGVRVRISDAPKMARLVASGDHVVRTAPGARGYRFVGVEIAPAPGVEMINVVQLGTGTETSLDELPQDIVFDRVYIHGDPVKGSRRGIAMNGVRIGVFNSYVSDFKQTCCDSQALSAWNGPGPFTIINNYLEAAGENIMFGGGDPSIANLVPSDIRILRNHIAKPLGWKPDFGPAQQPARTGREHDRTTTERDAQTGNETARPASESNWVVKNLLELKNARDVVIDGNTFEHNWADDQNGFAILFTPRNQDGASPWSVVENVLFSNNVVRHVLSGINILGWDNIHPSGQAKNIRILNNVFWDVGGAQWGQGSPQAYGYGQGGWFLQLLDATAGVVVEHNAVLATNGMLNVGAASPAGAHTGERHTGFVFRHNIVRHGTLGSGPAASVTDYEALTAHFAGAIAVGNLLIGGPDVAYPGGNVRVAAESDVGFVDWPAGDLRLASTSPYRGAAADGHDAGFDEDAFTTLPAAFTDATLSAGVSRVRAVHVTELRRRIDDLRLHNGLPAAAWTDATLGTNVTVKAVHLTEMRSALADVYAILLRAAPVYTDSTVTGGVTPIRAAHVSELRTAIAALE